MQLILAKEKHFEHLRDVVDRLNLTCRDIRIRTPDQPNPRMLAFGMRVLGYDSYLDDKAILERGAEPRTLQSLLADSDFVTLHTPSTEQTRHLIDATAIAAMKPSAWLINHARGALVGCNV